MAEYEDGHKKYVLNYHDSLLRQEDVRLLDGARWLNDKLIGFILEYFEYDQFKVFSDEAAFITPDVIQIIKFSEGAELTFILEPLNLASKSFVFLVINDHISDSTGGSHWSLLVFQRHLSKFSHFDSMGSSNAEIARGVAKKMQPYLKTSADCKFVEEDAPQQQNCYDCGIFVICTAEHLCKQFSQTSDIPLKTAVTQQVVTNKRAELKELILKLSSEDTR